VRILYLALLIAVAIFSILITLYMYNYAFATMSKSVDTFVEETRKSANITVTYTSFMQSLDTYIYGLNVVLVLALATAIVAVFLYSRRRA